jgi:hypothetical protein
MISDKFSIISLFSDAKVRETKNVTAIKELQEKAKQISYFTEPHGGVKD